MKNEICLQPYKITMSQNTLNTYELRVLIMCILKLKGEQIEGYNKDVSAEEVLFDDCKRRIVRISFDELGDIKNNHSLIVSNSKSLMQKIITIPLEKKGSFSMLPLLSKVDFHKYDNYMDLYFTREIYPQLVELGKNYTKFGVEFCFKTQCKYAIRWYQLACHWQKNGVFYMSIADIRDLFKINKNSYKRTLDLNNKVIKFPLKELKEKADLWLEIIETKKQGRKILGYTFKVHKLNSVLN